MHTKVYFASVCMFVCMCMCVYICMCVCVCCDGARKVGGGDVVCFQ